MACETSSITADLLGSYEELGGINHLDGANLPSKCAIASLCSDLLQILFPGFFEAKAIHRSDLAALTKTRIADVMARLEVESLPSLASRKNPPPDVPAAAHRLVCDFLHSLPRVRALLKTDVQAAFDGDPAAISYDEVILAYPGLEAIAIQRMAHVLYKGGVPLIPRMMTEWAHSRTGIDIHPGAEIGERFFIDHGTAVVIGETARLGRNVKLYQGVGLVARSLAAGQQLKGKRRHPCLEDFVTIYANATIVGDITVGRGSTIGANVFVTADVPPDSVVALGEQNNKVKPRLRPVPAA
jgi:serine O-acetyltransferase